MIRRAYRAARIGTILLMPLLLGCKESVSALGVGAHARTSADQLFTALADRHADVLRNAKYEYARVQLAHGALSPSQVFEDTAAWTNMSGPVRMLETFGTFSGGRYMMSSQRGSQAPLKPADGRHITTLGKLADGAYQWDTAVDFALGSVRPGEFASLISRLLTAGEGLNERDARANLAASSPRTAAVLEPLFTLDSLHPTVLPDGSTSVSLRFTVHSGKLRARLPWFSEYIRKYVESARIRLLVSDRAGVAFVDIAGKDRVFTINLRSQGGHLVPLAGPARPIPDTLQLLADFAVKAKMFTVGFHELPLEFVNSARGDSLRDWTFSARKEPKWNLPFITARLIRSPLRRPFAGDGALFRMGLRAGDGDQPTVLIRQTRLAVQESAILRFINSLAGTAVDDFGARVEHEENLWLRELFGAMREDARAMLP
ncbi:MAG: hypothetical protein V4550_13705 [Gemmatimonadota bacterium]